MIGFELRRRSDDHTQPTPPERMTFCNPRARLGLPLESNIPHTYHGLFLRYYQKKKKKQKDSRTCKQHVSWLLITRYPACLPRYLNAGISFGFLPCNPSIHLLHGNNRQAHHGYFYRSISSRHPPEPCIRTILKYCTAPHRTIMLVLATGTCLRSTKRFAKSYLSRRINPQLFCHGISNVRVVHTPTRFYVLKYTMLGKLCTAF